MNHRYSFITVPKGEVYSTFEKLIDSYGKQLHTPTYPTHLTLMHALEGTENHIVSRVEKFASSIKPFTVEVGKVEFSTTFFQCVFARVNATAELLNTHLALKTALGSQEKHVFMPHISIIYGDLPMETREQISKEITLPTLSFIVDHVTVVNGDNPYPKTWEVIKRIPFQSKS